MATWKKVLTENPTEADLANDTPAAAGEVLTSSSSDGTGVPVWTPLPASTIEGASDRQTSDTPSNDDVLKWNGTAWEAVPEGTTFNFQWQGCLIDTDENDSGGSSSGTTNSSVIAEMGASGAQYTDNVVVTHTINNAVQANFKSGIDNTGNDNKGVQIDEAAGSSYTDKGNLAWNGGTPTLSLGSQNLLYPTVTGTNPAFTDQIRIKTNFKYNGSQSDKTFTISFGNYYFMGMNAGSGDLDEAGIEALATGGHKALWGGSTTAASTLVAKSFTLTSDAKYIHLWYPTRITETPQFQVGSSANSLNPETGWQALSSTVTVTNAKGYAEQYKGYRSPNALDNSAASTWYVTVTFS